MGQLAKRITDAVLDRVASQSRPKVIVAYHGSPYDFDRFDASKIGTGEGAQSYGHGLYFAGAEDTGDWYRRKLSGSDDTPAAWARDFWEAQSAADAVGTPEAAHGWLLDFLRPKVGATKVYPRAQRRHYRKALAYLLEQDPRTVPPPVRAGRLYEVELGVPEESLLDWDAPIGQQSQPVRDNQALLEMAADEARNNALQARTQGRHDHWMRIANDPSEAPGSLAMQAGNLRRPVGASRPPMNPREFADYLMQSGVPGVRYLDGNSRGVGEGTRNYVMFPGTEDRIRILRKYGLLGPAAAGLMWGEE